MTIDSPTPSKTENRISQPDASWTGRPALAKLLRALIALAPVVVATAVTWVVAAIVPRPEGVGPTLGWFAGLVILSVAVLAGVERLARMLLPLTLLLRLTLVFPDEAPSRFALALRTSSTKELERTVQQVRERGLGDTDAEAAENLLVLVAALSEHDRLTRGHSERVRAYTELIAEEMDLPDDDRSKLRWAGLLHDVGKLYVPEEILNKPGRLTDEEFDVVKKHPEWGAQLVRPLAGWLGPWIEAVGQHHERWDGNGYPQGLAGTDIALAARIVSVADVFDVITSVRSYKLASTAVAARAEIARHSGTQFDPTVVRAFLNVGIGRLRRTMWPLTFLAQIPHLAPLIAGPAVGPTISGAVAASAVLAGSTGAALFDEPPLDNGPEGLAFAEDGGTVIDLDDPTTTILLVGPDGGVAGTATTTAEPEPAPSSTTPPSSTSTVGSTAAPTTPPPAPATTTTPPPTTPPPPTPATTTTGPTCSLAGVTGDRDPATGNCRFVGANLRSADLSGLDLRGFDFTDADLRDTDISGTDLRGAVLVDANLERSDLRGSDLRGADLTDAKLKKANLTGAGLAGADLHHVNIEEANLSGADLSSADLRDTNLRRANLSGAVLTGADLTDANLENANLEGVALANADLSKVELRNAVLTGATGTPISVSGTKFHDTVCPNGIESNDPCW